MSAIILRAWPGWTRSSRVEVMKSVGGYFTPSFRLWYGEKPWMNAHSFGSSGLPYSPIQLAPARSMW